MIQPCILSFTLPGERYPHGQHWRAGPYIYMGQMQPASSVGWSVNARCDSHTDFHLQQKIEYKSSFNGNDYKKVVYLV